MNLKYYASALSAFVIWGTFSIILKPLSNYSALEILLYRILFATVIIWLVSFLFRRKITLQSIRHIRIAPSTIKKKLIANFILSAVMLSLNWYLFIYVMNNISVNATSLAYLICPIVTTVLAVFFLEEKLKKMQWIAIGLSALSCILLSIGHFLDLFYSFIIALSYAIYLILQKKNKMDKLFNLSIHITLSTLMLLPLFAIVDVTVEKSVMFYEYIFIIAIVFTIIPLFLNSYALKGLSSSLVGILIYINPILSFLIAIFYFNEKITGIQIIAYSLILFAVILFNLVYFVASKRKSLTI